MTDRDDVPLTDADVMAILAVLDDCRFGELRFHDGELRVRVVRPVAEPLQADDTSSTNRRDRQISPLISAAAAGRLYWCVDMTDNEILAGTPLYRIRAGGKDRTFDSPRAGQVRRIWVADGDFVEYGQPVLLLDPA